MKRTIASLAAVAALTAAAAAGGAAPAQAQTWFLGGKIALHPASTGNLKVSGGLAVTSAGNYVMRDPIGWIAPGQNSRTHAHIYDADAFQAPWGCRTVMAAGGKTYTRTPGKVYKINDLSSVVVTVKC